MKVIVISSYAVIREGIVSIISKDDNISIQFACETINEAMNIIKDNINDVILLDIHNENQKELNLIHEIRASGIDIKSIILDFYGDNKLFVKALKCGVQGYILGKSNTDEILYAIDQICNGKKYFDSYFVDYMINENNISPKRVELLTVREREILIEISKGLSDRKISENLLITEHTVKKHINHIFHKLNINDRTEAIIYINKYKEINK